MPYQASWSQSSTKKATTEKTEFSDLMHIQALELPRKKKKKMVTKEKETEGENVLLSKRQRRQKDAVYLEGLLRI